MHRCLLLLAAATAGQPRVWVDSDCDGFHDAAAMQQLAGFDVVGASAVFGRSSVTETRERCAAMLSNAKIDVAAVSGASHYEDVHAANAAVGSITHALALAVYDEKTLTVVAMGALTNVASVAVRRPDLAESMRVVITCAFNDPEDVCVSKDWQALAALLRSPAIMTLAPPAPPKAWSADELRSLDPWLAELVQGPTRDPTVYGALRGERCEGENAWLTPVEGTTFEEPRFFLEAGDVEPWPTRRTAVRWATAEAAGYPDGVGLAGSLERCWGAADARARLVNAHDEL